MEHTWRKRQT